MTNKLYVGNLAYDVTEDDLKYNFGELGTCVSAKIIRDKHSGLSKGFAFVEMSTDKEAQEVIQKCKGVELDGKKLIVKEARPKSEKSPNRSGARTKSRRKPLKN
jgi:RNA recognition motif-containing protein